MSEEEKKVPAVKDEVQDDYEYIRAVYYKLISQGQDGIERAMELAEGSEHPRAFEVLFEGINKIAGISEKMMAHQQLKTKIDIERGKFSVDDAKQKGFVGSTTDLQRMLLSKLEEAEEEKKAKVVDVTPEEVDNE